MCILYLCNVTAIKYDIMSIVYFMNIFDKKYTNFCILTNNIIKNLKEH